MRAEMHVSMAQTASKIGDFLSDTEESATIEARLK